MRQLNICGAAVYLAQFDESAPIEAVQPPCRNDYINSATHPLVRAQRYWVWRLLDVALSEQFGKTVADIGAVREPSGKWVCGDSSVHFSLSHSGNVVAVAVSDRLVGVDVESLASFDGKNLDGLTKRILSSSEQSQYGALPFNDRGLFVLRKWCGKEALFKLNGNGSFVPAQQDLSAANVATCEISIGGETYTVAVTN